MTTEPFTTRTVDSADLGESTPLLNTSNFIRFFRADDPFDQTEVFPLEGQRRWAVGRTPERHLSADSQGCIGSRGDGIMSSRHAALTLSAGRWSIADAGSKNGTFVNGSMLGAPHMLSDGDVIECGHSFFVYRDLTALPRPFGVCSTDIDHPPPYCQMTRVLPYLDTDLSLHLVGERGTGKEVLARAIHNLSARKRARFVTINCAANPEALESELFGHLMGKVIAADGGTLFLDEIGELPPALQAKILRVLETKEITPVGASKPIRIDFRLVSATPHNLQQRESFRSDLRDRLGQVVAVPPLREHIEELGPLVRFFLNELMTTHRKETKAAHFVRFTLAASRALIGSRWPLNVRELKQCIETAATAALGEVKNGLCTIDLRHLGDLVGAGLWQKEMTASPSSAGISIRQEGDRWWLEAGERRVSLRDSKGLRYLAVLVQSAHKQVYALEISGAEEEGDAGVVLDEKAKAAYRARAEALRKELEESSSFNDLGRADRARRELDLLGSELTRAMGLGGRDRRAGSLAERARINVQRRLRDTFHRIAEQDPVLGRHVELSVKTGLFCVYAPTWPAD